MKKPHIEKFMSTDEWRQRGRHGGLRKEVQITLEALPESEQPGSNGWYALQLELPAGPDKFGDRFETAMVMAGVTLGFAFDPSLGRIVSSGIDGHKIIFRVNQPSPFWEALIALVGLGFLRRAAVALLPGMVHRSATGDVLDRAQVLAIEFLPPLGAELNEPRFAFIREWLQPIANGQPEKSERYELVAEALRELPAPEPEADPDQVMLEAMRELTAALRENTLQLRYGNGNRVTITHQLPDEAARGKTE